MPRKRLRTSDDVFMTSLYHDGDPGHCSVAIAWRKVDSIFSLLNIAS